jgi:hypothetical protein
MGVRTKFLGIVDPTFGSAKRIDEPADIDKKLKDGDLDAFIIEKPGLTDAYVLALTGVARAECQKLRRIRYPVRRFVSGRRDLRH